MYRTPVTSSNVASVGYDESAGLLEVEFHHGGVYQYFGVPAHIANSMLSAASIGGYHANHIKDRYQYQKVG